MNEYSPIISEFDSEEQEQSYLRWLEAKISASRADPRPPIAHDAVMAEMWEIIESKSKKAS
jgi:hypothetical protein